MSIPMKRVVCFFCLAFLFAPLAHALSKSEVRAIIEQAYPGARISEIEKETYKGERIHEVDFRHEGQKLEAIISLDGEIIKVGIDD
jgi:uncharacterized membrane protein YkoI